MSYDELVQSGALAPYEALSPILINMYTDVSIEVVKAVTQPDTVQAITQIIPLEVIISKVISMDYSDGDEVSSAVIPALRYMKRFLSDDIVAAALCRCLTTVSTNVSRKGTTGKHSISTKRKVVNGVLRWMREISERALAENESSEYARFYFSDPGNLKLYFTRVFPLLQHYNDGEPAYNNLVDLIWNLRQMDEQSYYQVLHTFDEAVTQSVNSAMDFAEVMFQSGQQQEFEDYPMEYVGHNEHAQAGYPNDIYAQGNSFANQGHYEFIDENGNIHTNVPYTNVTEYPDHDIRQYADQHYYMQVDNPEEYPGMDQTMEMSIFQHGDSMLGQNEVLIMRCGNCSREFST